MASTSGSKTSSSRKSSQGKSGTGTRASSKTSSKSSAKSSSGRNASRASTGRKTDTYQAARDSELFHEIGLIILFVAMVLLFLCNFGVIGPVGDTISQVLFGLFGVTAYIVPIVLFIAVAFWFANEGSPTAVRKMIAGVVLFAMVGVICDLIAGNAAELIKYDIKELYIASSQEKNGGGCLAGSLSFLLQEYVETIGTVLVVLLCSVICLILLTEKSLIKGMRDGGSRIRERSREDAEYRREMAEARRIEQEERNLARMAEKEERDRARMEEKKERELSHSARASVEEDKAYERGAARRIEQEEARYRKAENRKRREEERKLKIEEKENEKILRMDRKVTGVMLDTSLSRSGSRHSDDIHEITLEDLENHQDIQEVYDDSGYGAADAQNAIQSDPGIDFDRIQIRSAYQMTMEEAQIKEEAANRFAQPKEEMTEAAYEQPDRSESASPRQSFAAYEQPAAEPQSAATRQTFMTYEQPPRQSVSARQPESVARVNNRAVEENTMILDHAAENIQVHSEATAPKRPVAKLPEGYDSNMSPQEQEIRKEMQTKAPKTYIFPPLSRLKKGNPVTNDTTRELKETAMRLQQTLNTFGVRVTITDISQGPSVTRYELQPEQGVKVSKIVNLADDIKLNLAATDIRIEAPIPGKAAIGIEVPNKENTAVALRDLLESPQFKEFPSNLAFAVGKDIAGQVVVADIAKMPHMLIAGATGSGKSVCINTLIMSILYKAHPDDVKLIMVDPKVVELSVYNGIPHLLIPVVTDPKKASAALHWGVSEMTDRYKKFADFNVRDLKGYNKKVETMREQGQEDAPAKMPQIVIIVDELADLMMVSPGEVEESICRLAQLARAAGIHLIIATQRPSVDVITGLIKANMPSRVAFSVSSGVDSRTILDMNGAEKLLGKGDMLFYPQGYSKPARIQGAFVSDKEVSEVVDFLKNQAIGNTYAEEIEEQIRHMGSGSSGSSGSAADERDEYFEEAGRFIIDKDKASIGMLQRVLKIGFNRAARIMDQLAEYGVVGEEEGTKPRKVLMSMEQFEQLLEEI